MITKKIFLIALLIVVIMVLAILFLIKLADNTPALPQNPPVKKISVYISGQVKNISVVELEDDGNLKLADAVNAAGGLTDFADADAINLAAPLTNGQHIHIPTKDIFLMPQNISNADRVNINTADIEQLATLKGIGPVLAQRIIDYREQNGAFKSIDEIKNVRGIGDKKFAAVKDKITI